MSTPNKILLSNTFTFIQKVMLLCTSSLIVFSFLENRNFEVAVALDVLNALALLCIISISSIKTGFLFENKTICKGYWILGKLLFTSTTYNSDSLHVAIEKQKTSQRFSNFMFDDTKIRVRSEVYTVKINYKYAMRLDTFDKAKALENFLVFHCKNLSLERSI